MSRSTTKHHDQLEQLQEVEAKKRVAARHLQAQAEADRNAADGSREKVVRATAAGTGVPAAKKARAQAEAQAEDAAIHAEAARLQADEAARQRTEFESGHAKALIDELRPAASELVDHLAAPRDALIDGAAEWADMSAHVNSLVALVPGATPRYDVPGQHGLEELVRLAKDSRDVEVRSPLPHWGGVKAFEADQQEARRAKVKALEGRGDRTADEETMLAKLRRELTGRAA